MISSNNSSKLTSNVIAKKVYISWTKAAEINSSSGVIWRSSRKPVRHLKTLLYLGLRLIIFIKFYLVCYNLVLLIGNLWRYSIKSKCTSRRSLLWLLLLLPSQTSAPKPGLVMIGRRWMDPAQDVCLHQATWKENAKEQDSILMKNHALVQVEHGVVRGIMIETDVRNCPQNKRIFYTLHMKQILITFSKSVNILKFVTLHPYYAYKYFLDNLSSRFNMISNVFFNQYISNNFFGIIYVKFKWMFWNVFWYIESGVNYKEQCTYDYIYLNIHLIMGNW